MQFKPSAYSWFWAKKINDTGLRRELFEISVEFIYEKGDSDAVKVRMAQTPLKPVITNVSFNYAYDWEYDDIYPNGEFRFHVECADVDFYELCYSRSFLFSPDNISLLFPFCNGYDGLDSIDMSYDADWGEYVKVVAYNRYGAAISDTLYTSTYITDESVLNRLEELRKASSVDKTLEDIKVEMQYDNNHLFFSEEVKEMVLYTIQGGLMSRQFNIGTFDLKDISNGIYLIAYIDKKNNHYKRKILKK